jgi:hypothetical protein
MLTPTERILWELQRQPYNERMKLVVEVLGRMGMTTPARTDALGRAGRLWVVLGTLVLAGGLGFWVWLNAFARARLDLTTEPAAASVFIDGAPLGDQTRSAIIMKPGRHRLLVTMPGYTRDDRSIEVGTDETLSVRVKLEASPDTGFEITSEPRGLLVWLDGEPVRGPSGPARTDFRMIRISPGLHMVGVGGTESEPATWRRTVVVEPNEVAKVHAVVGPVKEPTVIPGRGPELRGDNIRRSRKHPHAGASRKGWLDPGP